MHAGQAEQFVTDRFKHSLLAAMQVIALLNVRSKARPSPERLVLAAPVVARLEVVSAIEPELPRVFSHGITPYAASHAVANVVVHLAVIDERPEPQIIVAAILVVRSPGIPTCRREHRTLFRHQLIHRQSIHFVRADGERGRYPGTNGPCPRRHAFVNEISEVRLRIVRVGDGNGRACRICGSDAVANQSAMRLQ